MKLILRTLFLLTFALCALPGAHAQADRGSVAGKITDNTGAIVPNAPVSLKNEATGVTQNGDSNASGEFLFQLLNPGSYTLTVSSQGFKTVERTHIVVDVNQVNS